MLGENASEASPRRANDVRWSSGKVSAYACAGVDASADVGVGADADAGVGVGEHGCEDARGYGHDRDYGDVGSLLSFEVVVVVDLVGRAEDVSDDGCVRAGVGVCEDEGEGTDFHDRVHTTVVHAGGVHPDQDAVAPVPK